eukprot:c18896_g1_i1 orf=586-819(+)
MAEVNNSKLLGRARRKSFFNDEPQANYSASQFQEGNLKEIDSEKCERPSTPTKGEGRESIFHLFLVYVEQRNGPRSK